MKNIAILFLACLLAVGTAAFAHDRHTRHSITYDHSNFLDGVDLDIEHHSIILTNDGYDDDIVEITRDYELYVNDRKIALEPGQAELVRTFYDQTFELIDTAKEIGLEGARIGMAGAKIGLDALVGVVRLLSPGYDTDDLEADLDRKASKIEDRAEELEKRADQVEDMAKDVEKSFDKMMDGVPALRDLGWSNRLTTGSLRDSGVHAVISVPDAPAAPAAPAAPEPRSHHSSRYSGLPE